MPCGRFCTAEATLTRASTRQSHSYGSPAVDHRGFNVWGTPGSWENESFIPVLLRQPSTGPHSQHRCSVTRGAGGVEPVLGGVAAAPRCGQPHPPRVSQPAAPTEAAARCAQRFQPRCPRSRRYDAVENGLSGLAGRRTALGPLENSTSRRRRSHAACRCRLSADGMADGYLRNPAARDAKAPSVYGTQRIGWGWCKSLALSHSLKKNAVLPPYSPSAPMPHLRDPPSARGPPLPSAPI